VLASFLFHTRASALTPVQVRAALGKEATATPEATRWCSDACVCRYLRARQWDVAKAAALLQATLEWRAAEAIDSLTVAAVAAEAETGKMQRLSCLDLHGRPVLLLRPGFENTSGMAGQASHFPPCLQTRC